MTMAAAMLTILPFLLLYAAAIHATTVDANLSFSYAQADKTLPPKLLRRYMADYPKPDGTVWLIPPASDQTPNQTMQKPGWLLYDYAFPWGGNTTSFSTAFHFQFITSPDTAADRIAFFISPHNTLLNYTSLLFRPSRYFFAAELDTNSSHAGFDMNSFIPYPTVDIGASSLRPDLDLYQNSSFMVWVDYYAANTSIELRMLNIDNMTSDVTILSRPAHPLLNLTYDLSTMFKNTSLFFGLSASTGGRPSLGCAIRFWNFTLSTPLHALESGSSIASNNPVVNFPQSSKSVSDNNSKRNILIPSILAVVILVAIATAIIAYWKRCCCSSEDDQTAELALIPNDVLVPAAMPRYTYKQLWKATQGFHDKARVGHGGFNTVYKGRLLLNQPSKKDSMEYEEVAVKRLNKEGLRKSDEFFKEINMVYQFMSNGSLADHLFSRKEGQDSWCSEE